MIGLSLVGLTTYDLLQTVGCISAYDYVSVFEKYFVLDFSYSVTVIPFLILTFVFAVSACCDFFLCFEGSVTD